MFSMYPAFSRKKQELLNIFSSQIPVFDTEAKLLPSETEGQVLWDVVKEKALKDVGLVKGKDGLFRNNALTKLE